MIQSLENIKKSVSEFPSLVPDLKEYLDNRCTHFRAGCLTESISNWQMITSDKEILTSVRGATIEFDTQPYNTKRPQSTFSAEESAIIDSEVAKLLSKNIIETTDHTPYEVISNIFIRPKKDGGYRLILNLKGLHQFVTYHQCKFSYIDDLYLQGRTYDLCVSNVIDTFIQFDSLGFTIHPDKFVLIPSQRLVLLGFIIDSVAMTITLTPEKALKVKEACGTLLGQGLPTIREVACVIGKIISSFLGVMYGQPYYRVLEHTKTVALKTAKGDFDSHMSLTEDWKKGTPVVDGQHREFP